MILIVRPGSILRGHRRVLRGGSFVTQASNVRSADRLNIGPANRNLNSGFRLALRKRFR